MQEHLPAPPPVPGPVQGQGPWSSIGHRNGSDIESDQADGGHLIGTLVGSAGEKINLVAQLSSVNRGEFRVMEKSWAEAMEAGKQVRVEVSPIYSAGSQVPSKIEVVYWIDGQRYFKPFRN